MSIAAFAVVAAAVCVASCMQASIGFGMGMLAAPVVALVEPTLLPATLIMSATLVTLIVVVRERASLDFRGTGWALAGRVPGTVAGTLLLVWIPESGLTLLLAAVVLGGTVVTLLGWNPAPVARNMAIAGAASGLLGTATSIGGPPMALVNSGREGAAVRGNMSAFFLVGSLMSLAALAIAGRMHSGTGTAFLALVPAVLLGYVASRWVNRLLDKDRLRTVSIVVSAAGAVLLLGHQVLLAT
ncbi:sulfite exporter TauE/SafE family protein [Rhodococcus artemisiae]|uniref:Probable membrane transporter protein n=1 Tax=Rhodococcus artemisiae TaxID=714159 RepID=A0ABU7L6E5_9NOCA|nr:sulfite exporter TauE/SafE family protein [Rhodococcus artemisiae]MEE2057116.1 sulfite exporter TauE/SafE family protein [Rhodococcus artemisiae]